MKPIKSLAGGLAQVGTLRVFAATILALFAAAFSIWAGTADDEALRQAAFDLNVVGVKAALQRGANPNAPSATTRRMTPLGELAMGNFSADPLDHNADAKALEIANLLFSS